VERGDEQVAVEIAKPVPYKLLIFTCYGGCATGVAASRACIRIWEENPDDVKIGCLPAVIVRWKLDEIVKNSEKRILIDACGVQCGAKLAEREGMPVDNYVELTSMMGIRKVKRLPSKDLEDRVYRAIRQDVDTLLGKGARAETKPSGKGAESEDFPDMLLRPVGVVRNKVEKPSLVADSGDLEWRAMVAQGREEQNAVSELVIDSDLDGILDGIEDFSHIMVLYWAHRLPPQGRSIIKAHPMGRRDLPLTGIFATCSPARPNPICLTAVRLLGRKDNVLKVEGLDAIDGSPLIDIKPYVPSYYAVADAKRADWMMQIEREFAQDSPEGMR